MVYIVIVVIFHKLSVLVFEVVDFVIGTFVSRVAYRKLALVIKSFVCVFFSVV